MSDDISEEQLPMSKEDYDRAIAQIEKVSQSVSKYEWTMERLQTKREKLLMQAIIAYWKSIALKDDFLYSIRLNYSTYEYDCGMLNENLTRELLNLDGIMSNGNDDIRARRKDEVKRVLFLQEAVTKLHEKAVALSVFYRSCVAQPRYQALLAQPSPQPEVELPTSPVPTSDVEQEAEEPRPAIQKQPSLQRQKSVHLIPVMSPEEFDKLQKQNSMGSRGISSEVSSAASSSAARRKHNREKKQRKLQRQRERRREEQEQQERKEEEQRRMEEEEREQREKAEEEERKRKMEEEEKERRLREKEKEEEEKERQRKEMEMQHQKELEEEEEERKRQQKLAEEERKKRELEEEERRKRELEEEERRKQELEEEERKKRELEEEERKKREQKRIEAQRRAEEKRKATEAARLQAEEARKKAEEAARQAEEAAKQAEEARRKAEEAEAMEVESNESEASSMEEEEEEETTPEVNEVDEIQGDYMPKYQWLRQGNKLNLILVNVDFDKSSLHCVTKPASPTPKLIIQGYRIVQETRPQGYYGVLYGMRPSFKYVPFTTVIQLPDIKVDLSQAPKVLYYDDESVMQVTYTIKQEEPKRAPAPAPARRQRRWNDEDEGYGRYYPRRSGYSRGPFDAYEDPYRRSTPMAFSPFFGGNFW